MARNRAGLTTELEVFDVEIGGESFVVMSLPTSAPAAVDKRLSTAEAAVARDAASGMSNAEIARKRGTAVRTVANQLASIYRKLGIDSRAQLAALLLESK